MNARRIALSIATAALLALPLVIHAQGPGFRGKAGIERHHDGPGPAGMLLGPVGDKIGLSDEQRSQIEAIFDAAREAGEALREQLEAERETYRQTHDPGDFDETEFRAHAEAQAALHVELQVQRMKAQAEAHKLLTAEQQQELKELRTLMEELHPRRDGQRGMRRGSN